MLTITVLVSDYALLFVCDRCLQLSRFLEILHLTRCASRVDDFGEHVSRALERRQALAQRINV
jgi:hypothetical protein